MSDSDALPSGLPKRYQWQELLGRGGMGRVFAAFDTTIRRRVAIKLADPPIPGDPESQAAFQRFRREAQVAGGLKHEHIVGVYDFGEEQNTGWMVMELVEGGSLRDLVRGGTRLTLPEIVRLVVQVLDALTHCHEQGVIHCDIKPANIMLTAADSSGEVKLTDFGIAQKRPDYSDDATIVAGARPPAESFIGTPAYMAPEQATPGPFDHRVDIWATGILLYELLTEKKPFSGNGPEAVSHAILNTEPEPPSRISVMATPAFDAVVARALAKDPAKRYPDARSFAAGLLEAARARRGDETRAMPAPPPPAAKPSGGPAMKWIGAGVAVAAIAGAAFFLLPRDETPPTAAPVEQALVLTPPQPAPTSTVQAPAPTPDPVPAPAPIQAPAPTPPPVERPEPAPQPVLPPVPPPAPQPVPQPAPGPDRQPAPAPPPQSVPQPVPAPMPQPDPRPAPQLPGIPPLMTPPVVTPPPLTLGAGPVPAPPVAAQPLAIPPVAAPPLAAPTPARPEPPVAVAPTPPPRPVQPVPQLVPAPPPPAARMENLLANVGCGVVQSVAEAGRFVVTGFLHTRAAATLRRDAEAANLNVMIAADVFDAPYCDVLTAIEPITPTSGAEFSVEARQALLRRNEQMELSIQMPPWPAHLNIWFVMHDGNALKLIRERPMEAGARVNLRESSPDFPWIIDEPFGLELVVVVASERPMFATPRPLEETAPSLAAALEEARRDSRRRLAARAIMVETRAR